MQQLYYHPEAEDGQRFTFNRGNAEEGHCPLHGRWNLKQGNTCPVCRAEMGSNRFIKKIEHDIEYYERIARFATSDHSRKCLSVLYGLKRRAVDAYRAKRRQAYQERRQSIIDGVMAKIS